MRYQRIVSNFAGNARTEWFGGREFLVSPVVLVVPGVLNGSRGPLYYPPDELRRNPHSWNGVPLVLNHPSSGTARIPSYMRTNGVGVLARVLFANNRLRGEAWFDVQKTSSVDGRLLSMVRSGEAIEVSTGVGVAVDNVGGYHNGRHYTGIARDYQPDHLAILLHERGACDLMMGCGIGTHN